MAPNGFGSIHNAYEALAGDQETLLGASPTESKVMAPTSKRDAGLVIAIDRIGGISQLARALGLSQPTVSVWRRVPPHRVIEIEALTGISRRILRPDPYDVPEPAIVTSRVPEIRVR